MRSILVPLLALGALSNAYAGRPLTVDDASSNDAGKGHIELWVAREAGNLNTTNISPAYGVLEGLEIAALFSRETNSGRNLSAAQFKWIATHSEENGCNLGVVAGAGWITMPTERVNFANGLVTCNSKGVGSIHFNVGVEKPQNSKSVRTWGVAVEREIGGMTPHLEVFSVEGAKSTVQFGLRGELAKSLQLDGTVARVDGETTYSVGLKIQF